MGWSEEENIGLVWFWDAWNILNGSCEGDKNVKTQAVEF
jgi:hypothetical protein